MRKARAFLSILTAIIAVASAVIVVVERISAYKHKPCLPEDIGETSDLWSFYAM